MAISHSYNMNNDGMVFMLDAANPKSWKGIPTINLANTSGGSIDWSISNLTATVTLSTIDQNSYKYRITSTGTAGSFRIRFNQNNLINGETYTVSYKFRIISGDYTFYATDWNDQSIIKNTTLVGDYYYETATGSRATYDNIYRFLDFYIGANTVVDIWEIQLEHRATATDFTSYQRNTWLDLSGNDYHATFYNGASYSEQSKTVQFRSASSQYAISVFDEGVLKQSNELGTWSIETLFKYDSAPSDTESIIAGRSGSHGGIYVYPDNNLKHAIKTTEVSSWTGAINTTVVTMIPGSWYHSVMSYENGYIKHFVNGSLVGNSTFDRNTYDMQPYGNNFYIGGILTRYTNTDISMVRCYNIPLNEDQALSNWSALQGRIV